MNQLIKYLFCFLLSVVLLSCNNDESAQTSHSTNLDQIKNDLNLSKFSNVNISENIEVNWEKTTKSQNEKFKIQEIQVNEKTVSSLHSDFLQKQIKYEIIQIEVDGQSNSYFLEVYSNDNGILYPETITKLNNFTGTLNVFLLNGKNLGSVSIFSGIAKNISKNESLEILTLAIDSFSNNNTITNKIPLCDKTYTQVVYQYTDRYDVWTVGNTIVAIQYKGTLQTITTALLSYPCDGSGDRDAVISQRIAQYSHIGGGGYTTIGMATAEKIEESINGDKLDPCTKEVLDKMKNLKQSDIASMINRFNPAESIFNINITIGQVIPSRDWAQTTKVNGSSTDINMIFNEDYIRGTGNSNPPTDLSVATTMAHEIIHSYLISLLEDNKTNGASEIQDFPTIYDAYVQQKITNDKSATLLKDAHHELIASN